ncbi:citrate lyase acyl carrier protein [Candidatus Vecturithrix granuli]|uniref:Citrate lyase acyl carrier protein n=1 Tax=Vecturithrix granuli TaxID=1499967 RepID=A0A081BWA6_VECG1|nr:citrate lyase acyl carrier protein [Candidatus Vecturithrix granuli]
MELLTEGIAGTLESSDALVKIRNNPETGIQIHLQSVVEKRYGKQIRQVIADTLARLEVRHAWVEVNDKGALDCTIRARLQAAVFRAAKIDAYPWEEL